MANSQLLSSSKGDQYYKDDAGEHEKAIYGALCGNRDAMLKKCETWLDHLWAGMRSHFTIGVIKRFLAQREEYSILFGGSYSGSEATPALAVSYDYKEVLNRKVDSVIFNSNS